MHTDKRLNRISLNTDQKLVTGEFNASERGVGGGGLSYNELAFHSGRSRDTACRFMPRKPEPLFANNRVGQPYVIQFSPLFGFSTLRSPWIIFSGNFRKRRQL